MIGLNSTVVEQQSGKTYQALAEEIFGTTANPTISNYYYVNDTAEDIESTIVNKIYSNIIVKKDNTLKNFVIKDYFPKEIIDNFNFEYVASPNLGKISQKVDTTDNSITWTIPELKEGETATVSYKLTLKDNYNKEIINKILPTNTKVDLKGEDSDGKKYEETSTDSPKVRVLYEEPQKDNTIANTVIPQTGEGNAITTIICVITTVGIIAGIRYFYLKKNS